MENKEIREKLIEQLDNAIKLSNENADKYRETGIEIFYANSQFWSGRADGIKTALDLLEKM